ncbi:transmembrane protein, putative (macronuclear) [Tetrahymena thermophila SB210]|uniref:Transmembrane protein, putative n=1 Tax=Tetrahymena thermophila (strain SB210) TaxID=312017 RepID=I7MGX5_TETTS|nr:transmembrane protein, putative [Tetrahymena thermophila SB210]EAR85559.2 transmembrane protein, putative [Tetrahymena thermophila SB210]|eukprot:XP_001033222.2 transmembrane protein, putative [Tetrahymena thermophila SB210]
MKIQAQFIINHSQKQYIQLFAIGFLLVIVQSQAVGQQFILIIEELNCVLYDPIDGKFGDLNVKFFVENGDYDGNDKQTVRDNLKDMEQLQYYIDNNQVYIQNSRYGYVFLISFDLRVDFNQIRDESQNPYLSLDGFVKKQGQYYYYLIPQNGQFICIYATQEDQTYTFYDFSTFTVLQTSGQIKQTNNIIQNSLVIQNIIMVYHDSGDQKIIFRYNIQTQKVDIIQSDWKNSQYRFSNLNYPYQGKLVNYDLGFSRIKKISDAEIMSLQIKEAGVIIIWHRKFFLATCRDYCDDCQQAINSQQCLQCLLSYFLQPDNITCEKSCPSLSIQNHADLTCDCVQNAVLINNQCQCKSEFQMVGNACTQCSIPNCDQCKDSIACMKCKQGYYLFEDFSCNTCNISNGYYINGQNCLSCFHSCQTCEGPNQYQCLSCKLPDFYMFQDKQCKVCDVNNGYFISNQNCISCFEHCKTCLDANQNQCTSCYEGYDNINNFCQQTFLNYNSQVFTEQKIQQIQQLSSSTSSVLVVSTSVMSLIENIGSNSSYRILISSLTIQKLAYLYLLNVNLPKQIYSVLEILSGKLYYQTIYKYFFYLFSIQQIQKILQENYLLSSLNSQTYLANYQITI